MLRFVILSYSFVITVFCNLYLPHISPIVFDVCNAQMDLHGAGDTSIPAKRVNEILSNVAIYERAQCNLERCRAIV